MSAIRTRLALVSLPLIAGAVAVCAVLPGVYGQDGPSAPPQADKAQVVTQARQILQKRCSTCHGKDPDNLEADLNVFDRAALVEKKIVVPGKPDSSRMIGRVTSERKPMPPKPRERLPDSEVQILRDWIAAGAPALADTVATAKATPPVPPPAPAAPAEAPAAKAQEILTAQCAACHGGTKPDAGFRIDDRDTLVAKGFVVPADADKSRLVKKITAAGDLRMPPEGDGRRALTPAEVAAVRAWIQGGAPSFEPPVKAAAGQVGDEYVLRSILADVHKLAAANERLDSYRYFSLNHLLAGGITAAELEANRQAFTLVVNHLSRKKEFAVPQPIEPTGTVFRLDVSQLGWDRQPLQPKNGGDGLSLFDLVLLDYPYGVIHDGSPTYRQLLTEYLQPTRQVRPVAFVRADWFVNTASRPPLYEDLLELPATFEALQKQLGVDVADDVKNARARRAGVTVSGVSRNNRIVERHEPDNSAYLWVSYDYKTNKGTDNIFQNPIDLHPTGGEMIFSLPNGLQGFYVATGKGTRLDAAPTEIVTDKFASDQTVRNGLACMRCHGSNGMRTFTDDVRPVLQQLSGSPAGFDLTEAQRLYPPQPEMARLVARDSGTFRRSVERLFDGKPPQDITDTLDHVSHRFLDNAINVRVAAEEVGVSDPERIEKSFQNREFAAVGLMELGSGGAVRRDTWEDDYDQVVEHFGRGVPVVPIDGVTRSGYERADSRVTFTVSTNRQTLKAGDVLVVTLKNTSSLPIFVELVGTGTEGQKAALTPDVVSVAAGGTLTKKLKVNAITGRDQITVYASDAKFEKGELFVLPDADREKGLGMGSRFVHRGFYQLPAAGGRLRPDFDPARMVKKTIEIETQ